MSKRVKTEETSCRKSASEMAGKDAAERAGGQPPTQGAV